MGGFAACCGLLTWDLNAHFGEGLDMGPSFRSDEHFALYLFVDIVAVVGTSLTQYTYTTVGPETRAKRLG